MFTIKLNGQTIHSVENKVPRIFNNVKVYASGEYNNELPDADLNAYRYKP